MPAPLEPPTHLRLSAAPDGGSFFTEDEFPLEALDSPLSGPVLAAPLQRAVAYGLRIVPAGSRRDWGPAAHPTVAVYLSGQAEIEASNGDIRRLTPGTVLVADDTTGRGHRARVVGSEPVTVMHIVLPDNE